MKILQTIIEEGDQLYVFTDNPKIDIDAFIEKYENEESTIHLGCETPAIGTYKFLGKEYEVIVLGYDKQDDITQDSATAFNNLI